MYLPSIEPAAPPAFGVKVAWYVPRANAQSPPARTSSLEIFMLKANRSNIGLWVYGRVTGQTEPLHTIRPWMVGVIGEFAEM